MKKKYFEGKHRESTKEYIKQIEEETKEVHYVEVSGKEFAIFPTVFSPKYFKDPEFFVKELPIKEGEEFLEVGCGSGIVSIFAVLKGASRVVSMDINPKAVENTKHNAELHKVKIEVLEGDVYSALEDRDDKFDTIFWNVPFGMVKERNLTMIEKSLWDTEYEATEKFIKEGNKYLKEGGRLLIGFSSNIGDLDYLFELLEKYSYSFKIIKEVESTSVGYHSKFEIIEAKAK